MGERVLEVVCDLLPVRLQHLVQCLSVGVAIEIALLFAHALHFHHAEGLERSTTKGVENFLNQKRLHDGDDLFHWGAIGCRLSAVSESYVSALAESRQPKSQEPLL